jgi:tyrosyl-tRNA synthetase
LRRRHCCSSPLQRRGFSVGSCDKSPRLKTRATAIDIRTLGCQQSQRARRKLSAKKTCTLKARSLPRKTGQPLRIKLGVDPTAPDLHLGHTVVLRKLKHFQDQGHTASVPDRRFHRDGRRPHRPVRNAPAPLTSDQVRRQRRRRISSRSTKSWSRERTEVRYNSEWLGKLTGHRHDPPVRALSPGAHARARRLPLAPGWITSRSPSTNCSIRCCRPTTPWRSKADVELGATEQKFNLLAGREMQREYGQKSQVVLTMPILVGIDGQRKMSKSRSATTSASRRPPSADVWQS